MRKHTVHRNALLKKVRRRVGRAGLNAFLVTGGKDILYLAGYFTEGAKLLISAKGRPVYFVDRMNEALARDRLDGLELEEVIAGAVQGKLKDYVSDHKLKKIGINEKQLSSFEYKSILGRGSFRFKHLSSLLEDMRQIKQDFEISIIRKAARETVKIWREIRKNVETGMTEKDIAAMIDVLVRALGYENSFPTIAAIGKNSAYPHAVPTSKHLKDGEHLLVDFGIRFEGYCSDLTRTYSNGRINRKIANFRRCVREAHDRTIKMVKPGVIVSSLAAATDTYFNNNNLGDHILHGLGHGVGLDIHEGPFLRKECRGRLRKGMVITIEPGLYQSGLGGIREEDMVLVTENGCEVLTK